MRREYFLTRSTDSARRITDELLLHRIPESDIHIITHSGDLPEDLPEATIDESSDFFPALFKGFGMGAVAGLVIGVLLVLIPWTALSVEILTSTPFLAATMLFGGLIGAFAGAIVGVSVPNPRLDQFERELDAGQILIMADVPRDRVEEIRKIVQKTDSQAKYCGVEPLKPAFP